MADMVLDRPSLYDLQRFRLSPFTDGSRTVLVSLNLIGLAARVMSGLSLPGSQVSSIWRASTYGSPKMSAMS